MLGRIDAGGYHRKPKTLKPYQQRSGYLNIKLRDAHGNRSPHLVHRLVANAFIDNQNHYPQVNHIDENVKNNRVDNLEWCTVEYNLSYGNHRDHCAKTLKNNSTNNAKLRKFAENQRVPVKQINSDGIVINIWPSMSAASKLGFKVGRISDCCKGKQKEHHGYRWELAQS